MKRKPGESSREKTHWRILVYLAGDNNLSADMVWNLQEMAKSADDPRLRDAFELSVLFDPAGANPRRFDIVAPGFAAGTTGSEHGLGALRFVDYPEGATARELLQRFLSDRLDVPPRSAHRLVVLSGHGSGAAGEFLSDEDPKSALRIPDLERILKKVTPRRRLDILGLDSCEMSGIEVAYEVRRRARYLVASEGWVFDAGWPYHRVVQSVATEAADASVGLARELARRYLAFYKDYERIGLSTDVSVLDLGRIEPVAQSIRALAKAMATPLARLVPDGLEEAIELGELQRAKPDAAAERARAVRNAILLAHWSAQAYKCDRYTDLHDFVEQLLRFSSGEVGDELDAIRKAGARVLKAISASTVFSGSTGAEFQHSHGLSIYFPWSRSDSLDGYRKLAFNEATGWADFLEVYLRSTVRMRRDQKTHVQKSPGKKARVVDSDGNPIAMLEPLRNPRVSLPTKDVDSGTHKDVDSGTHKGRDCRSTMKNPPDGFYHRTSTVGQR